MKVCNQFSTTPPVRPNASAGFQVSLEMVALTVLYGLATTTSARAELNDTGISSCATEVASTLSCNDIADGTDMFPGQDAETGRDVTEADDTDGRAGFAMTKLDGSGSPLADQSADYATSPWDCVRDEVTGLVWEVKTDDGGLHDADWSYSWFDSTLPAVGITQGFENAGSCVDTSNCDTEKFAASVNAQGLCGATDWRSPTRVELQGIIDYGAADPLNPFLADFFPNTGRERYWSGQSETAFGGSSAWSVYFGAGTSLPRGKFEGMALRLVRGQLP